MKSFRNYHFVTLYLTVMLEQTLSTVSTMLGTMLVSGLGTSVSAGIGMVDQINFVFMNILTCIATGITAIVSQCVGKGDIKKAQDCANHSITISIYASIVISAFLIIFRAPLLNILFGKAEQTVLDSASIYLFFTSISLPFLTLFNVFTGIRRATGDNLSPLIGVFLSNIFYVIVTIFCIKVLNLGISSVGYGLLVSRIISSLILQFFIYFKPRMLKLPKPTIKVNFNILKPVLDIAITNSVDGIIFNGGKLLVQVFMSGMGTAALSANTICNSISNFIQLPGKTFQVTCVPFTGTAYGSGDMEKTKKVMLSQTLGANISQLIMNIIFYIFCSKIYFLYTDDLQVLEYSLNLINSFLILSPIFWATSFMTPSALRATGDAKFTMTISVLSLFIFRIFFSWLLGVHFNYGIYGIWAGMYIDWLFRSVLYFSRIFSKKWHAKNI
ncbi:MATE family efflux transporter [uncultured Tyzzerella sp.]|uniref:MATE family efflux transporter n=1 Tax=uncultured Tyzzerella sp. TaxID=2321398 RepID=UPI002942F796|nr:MATE family efflux transporter [uncultured Tyzzerella sp.]